MSQSEPQSGAFTGGGLDAAQGSALLSYSAAKSPHQAAILTAILVIH
jgi:hypothetical protein